MIREMSERNAPPQNHHTHFYRFPMQKFCSLLIPSGWCQGFNVEGQEEGAHLLIQYIAKKVGGGAPTVPGRSFACQLGFLDFDSCLCPGPFLSMMSSFVILDFETAKNPEHFNLKDRSVST